MTDQTSHDAVLGAARELFQRKGFASTSVREICDGAGVTPPVLYYHFGSKEGLFEAVVEETVHLDGFCRQLREAIEGVDDPWEKLRAYVHTYLTGFPQGLLNPGLHFQSSTELNDRSLRQMGIGIAEIHHLAQELLEEGIAAGCFRAMDVGLAASCLLGLVDSFVRARVYLGVDYDVCQVEDCVLELVSQGIIARSDDQARGIVE